MSIPNWLVWQLSLEMIVIGIIYGVVYKDYGRGLYFLFGGAITLVSAFAIK